MDSITLYRIDTAKNMRRFYRLAVQEDLFGRWTFTREWGRIGHRGQTVVTSFESASEAESALDRLRNAKAQRGYRQQELIEL